ncbi:hypothetical protein L210DRAFT_3526991 [Boletus edulis BED1]|uniref:Zinc finger GRF-type domain-containing protein n=1 Tax=Boletus edulis BED1 TaxID=1328754 RepID=A0AAD4GKG1_BOLED|nr:hypothetical protein L210DRAFT_3526991 [Boletus edulis BED1]
MDEAAKHESTTLKNPNRDFYCCKRSQGDANRCKFWHWADQVPRLRDNQGGPRVQPVTTPSVRTSQQQFSPPRSPAESPQRRKRMDAIEAGLRQREQDIVATRPSSSMERGASTSPSGVQADCQPASPVPTEPEPEVEAPPRRSFLGLLDSPELHSSTMQEEGQPSTPKKRRISLPTEGSEIPPRTAPFGGGLPLTPPQTIRRGMQPDGPEPVSPIVRSRKGKERESVLLARTHDQDRFDREPQEEDSLPLFTLPEDTSSTSSVSPTIAENVLDYNDGIKARVKALSEYVDSFDIAQAAKSLQTIERQKIQYEYRDRSQKMRIEELVEEKDILIAEITQLKEALERSERRNRIKDEEVASYKALVECD